MSEIMNNDSQNWDNFNTTSYYDQYLDTMLVDDRYLTSATVIGLHAFRMATGVQLGTLENGVDYGNGGAPLSAAFGAPFVVDRPRSLAWQDRGRPQLIAAEQNIIAGQQRNLPQWEYQQAYMGSIHVDWSNCIYYAADIGFAMKGDGFSPDPNSTAMGEASFFHESATSEFAEWEHGTMSFFRSVTPGGLVINRYMIGSTGYTSAGEEYRSTEIYPEQMLSLATQELTHIQNYSFFKPQDATHNARPEGDRHGYKGMGVLIGQRSRTTSHIV